MPQNFFILLCLSFHKTETFTHLYDPITIHGMILQHLKVICIRPMTPVLNTGPVSGHEMLSFSVRKEIKK